MTPHSLLDALWSDFVQSTPQAERIRGLLTERGEWLQHEHVALRTFAVPGIGNDAIAGAFEELGWVARQRSRKNPDGVRTRRWEHPDPELPCVSISELAVGALSTRARGIVAALVAQLPPGFGARRELARAGRPWQVTHADYRALAMESAHAAWLAAYGFRAHHMAVDVTAMATFPDVVVVTAFLGDHGFGLDAAATTLPDTIEVAFSDQAARVQSGTYGFALRSRRGRERGEVVVELEQHIDVNADELHAHAAYRRPPHHGR